jgi:NitT/TauT family transport system substrate-binding protein
MVAGRRVRVSVLSRTFFGVVVLMALGLSACGQEGPGKPAEEITLAVYAGSDSTLVYIAQEQGFFADNGLEVTLREYEAGKLAGDAVIAGEADIATSSDFVFVSNSLESDDLRVLGTISESDLIELVARKDRGISTPADLKGKRIGVTRKSAGEFYLGTFLTFNGLSLSDVEIVDLNPSEIVEAISGGEIDAGLTWNPNIYNMKQALGENAVSWPGQSGQAFYFVLLARAEFLSERSLAVERFLRALVQAEDFVEAHNEEAKEFIRQTFDYDAAYLDSVWPGQKFTVMLPQAMLIVFEDQARWRIENGLTDTTSIPNFLDRLYMDGLEVVRPEAVTVVR